MRLRNLALLAIVVAMPSAALADPVADFYRGKQIKLIVSFDYLNDLCGTPHAIPARRYG